MGDFIDFNDLIYQVFTAIITQWDKYIGSQEQNENCIIGDIDFILDGVNSKFDNEELTIWTTQEEAYQSWRKVMETV
jgi:hypothetical protein